MGPVPSTSARRWPGARTCRGIGTVVLLLTLAVACVHPAVPGVPPPGTAPVPCAPARRGSLDTGVRVIDHDGLTRRYTVDVPKGYDGRTPVPMIFNLHGFGAPLLLYRAATGVGAEGAARGYLVVSPEGGPLRIPDDPANKPYRGLAGTPFLNFFGPEGFEQAGVHHESPGADDFGFIAFLIDTLSAEYCVDTSRVFATGTSNGAMMSNALACEMPRRFAAIVPVAGVNMPPKCTGSAPVPVLAIHGDADWAVPYGGGSVLGFAFGNPSVPDRMQQWATINHCDPVPRDDTSVAKLTRRVWTGCADGAATELWTVHGLGHTWPRASRPDDPQVIDATKVALDFFDAHRRPAG